MWNLKRDTDDLIYKTEIDSQTENKLVVIQGKRGGGINWEFGINIYTLLYVKQINNKDLLYNIGNYIQHLITNIMKRIIYVCVCIYHTHTYIYMYIYNITES